MVTSAPRFDVPDTDKLATFVIAPSTSALPVIVKLKPPPLKVEALLIVEPANVRFAPDTVTAPV